MSVQPKPLPSEPLMDVDQFLAWSGEQPGRYELFAGEVFAMSPQRVRHAESKFAVQLALRNAIRAAGLPCRMLPDGLAVRVDRTTAYEPDALVRCGPPLDGDATEAPDPVIVVEVLSPGTKAIDTGLKLEGYFRLESVAHYLIVDPGKRTVIHHRRGAGDLIETRILSEGSLDLTPPGLTLALSDVFAEA